MLKLDGTPNKGNLGANAVLGASLAISKAGAGAKNIPLFQHYAEVDLVLVRVSSHNFYGNHSIVFVFSSFLLLVSGTSYRW